MSAYENLKKYLKEEESHFSAMMKYFERYRAQEKDNAVEAAKTKQ